MENVHANQVEIVGAIRKIGANIKKDGSERKTLDYFKRKLEVLESYWQDYQKNHSQLVKSESRTHPYFTNSEYEIAREQYNSVKNIAVSGFSG
ncbi:unnamed protein product [Parnassius apollo]|uniref:(apollo) hypothetical protein n=1 Tax=Parnassius apollo TaxID=110799 RepID=A0A8S3WGK2_PARAO|nr:unnamed protein product [Parnassius apollo]